MTCIGWNGMGKLNEFGCQNTAVRSKFLAAVFIFHLEKDGAETPSSFALD